MRLKTMIAIVAKTTTPWATGRSKLKIDSIATSPEARKAEDLLGEDRAAEREADVHAEHRHDGQHRVAQDVRAHHAVLGRALGARGAHVVLVHRLHHVRADHAHVEGGEERAKRVQGRIMW